MASKSKQLVNVKTGEVIDVRGTRRTITPPNIKQVTPINQVAGKNPIAINLKDHPELSGQHVIIVETSWKPSTLGGHLKTFVLFGAYVCPPDTQPTEDQYQLFMTGAENVQARLADAEMQAGEGSPYPLSATLRCSKGGQAWFLD
jgi:hypothetical protein